MYPRQQSSWGQHGAHLGPVGPRWTPCWPHELAIRLYTEEATYVIYESTRRDINIDKLYLLNIYHMAMIKQNNVKEIYQQKIGSYKVIRRIIEFRSFPWLQHTFAHTFLLYFFFRNFFMEWTKRFCGWYYDDKKPTGYWRYCHSRCRPLAAMDPGVHTMSDELILQIQISCNIFLAFKWILIMRSGQNISHYTTAKLSVHVWKHGLIWW